MAKVSIQKMIGKGYNQFWHDKHFYRVVKGSRGSKKSKTTALNFIYRIMKYPWANLLVIRRFSNTNKQSTYTDLKWAINQLGVNSLFKCNESLPEITYIPTGQKILFRGLDDELKITSITVDVGVLSWAWFEEAYQIERPEKFQTVVESIRGSNESPDFFKQITVSFNPWSERHWLKAFFFDKETQLKDTFSMTTTFRCNEWLDDQDKQRYEDLYRTNPRRARIVCDGQWGVAEGLVLENFRVQSFDIQQAIKSCGNTQQGMDYGFRNDPTTFIASAIDLENKKLYIYDEHYELAMTTDDIYKTITKKGYQDSEIVGDSAEPRLIAELKQKGLRRIRGSRKGKDSILHGINFLQGFEIIIHPSCVHTIDEFNTYCYQQDKDGNWLNKPEDRNNHIIDALRYSVEKYSIKVKNSESVENKINRLKQLF